MPRKAVDRTATSKDAPPANGRRAAAAPASTKPASSTRAVAKRLPAAFTASKASAVAPARSASARSTAAIREPAAGKFATPRKPAAAAPAARKLASSPAAARKLASPRKPAAAAPAAASPATRKLASPVAARKLASPRKPPAASPAAGRLASTAASRKLASPVSPARRKPAVPAIKPEAPAAPARLSGGIAVVKLLDSKQPMEALRKFLARIAGEATMEEGQIVLGSAQLMLLPIAHEHRGGDEVKQLLDLVLARWDAFPDRSGFHAQEFLRNAFAAVGDDRERLARLAALVPLEATSELRFNLAGAYAVVGDRPAMLRALEVALATGTTAAQVRRDPDFTGVLHDPGVIALLDRAAVPAIPVDVDPYVAPVRAALDTLVDTLRELGEPSRFNPPATLEAVLAAERAKQIQLPNDYRALLTITDGMALCDHEFFGTGDYRSETQLAQRARAFLEMSVSYGGIGMDECVPLASWGQPNNWLLYDPRGAVREGDPGYVVMLTADPWPMTDLADALLKIESSVRDARATN
jgi:hypothetical protein